MKFKLLLLLTIAGILSFTACEEDHSEEIEKTYDLSGFTKIDLGDAFRIEISKGDTYEVKARGTVRNLDDLEMKVVNGKLMAHYEPFHNSRNRSTEITIQLPKLTYLRLSGATETDLNGFFSTTESLELSVDGASKLDADMQWKSLDLKVSGASEIQLSGEATEVEAGINGASRFYGSNFRTKNFEAQVSGVSKAHLNVTQALTGSASGNSEIRYSGNPANVQVEVSGNSNLGKL